MDRVAEVQEAESCVQGVDDNHDEDDVDGDLEGSVGGGEAQVEEQDRRLDEEGGEVVEY